MPSYSPYGSAIFGTTTYGVPPLVNEAAVLTVSPVLGQAGVYSSLLVNWGIPSGNWNELVLVRSSYGIPVSPFASDGVTLVDYLTSSGAVIPTLFVDTGLQSGRFFYYALFVFDTDVNEWIFSAGGQGLCLTDFGFDDTFKTWTPDFYLELDLTLATDAQPEGPLERFLDLLGFETNWIRSEIESLFLLTNADLISGALLPYLGGNFGVGFEPSLGETRSRVLIDNAVNLYKEKGTLRGVQAAASAYTGYGCIATLAPNLEIQLDDAAFDRSIGHWVPTNGGTSITAVSSTVVGVTPEHTNYSPAPASAAIPNDGYLPANNENMAQITASPTPTPSARAGSMMTFNRSQANELVLFGGYSNGVWLNDLWSFALTGAAWQQLFSNASPSPRSDAVLQSMTTPVAASVLFGGRNGSNVLGDTWTWNGVNWTQQFPAHSPAPRYWAASTTMYFVGGPLGQGPLDVAPTPNILPILHGGTDGKNVFADTWAWSGTDWVDVSSYLSPTGVEPPGLYGHSMTFNRYDVGGSGLGTGQALLWGGLQDFAGTYAPSNVVWRIGTDSLANNQWAPVSTTGAGSPSQRAFHAMGTSIQLNSSMLFGGQDSSGAALNDTWGLDITTTPRYTWVSVGGAAPPARYWFALGNNLKPSPDGEQVVMGGYDGTNFLSDTWLFNDQHLTWSQFTPTGIPHGIALSECNSTNASTLGLPITQQATPSPITFSMYFQPVPTATHTLEQFYTQLDWYAPNGALLSSTVGSSVTEVLNTWVRAHVTGTPPNGAYYVGRTVKSVSTNVLGDLHLMDAGQTENAASASSWAPPRDVWVNLFPARQNLVANGQGLVGTTGYDIGATSVTLTAVSTGPTPPSGPTWPADTSAGFKMVAAAGSAFMETTLGGISLMPVTAGELYSGSWWAIFPPSSTFISLEIDIQWYATTNPASLISTTAGPFITTAEINAFGGAWFQATNVGVTAPVGANYAELLFNGSAPNGTIVYSAAPYFGPGSSTQYFDGSFSPSADYSFEGTANQSISDWYPNFGPRINRLVSALADYMPFGATFSIITGAEAFTNAGRVG